MRIPDSFSHEARWDSVGLSCACCCHFRGPEKWPDLERAVECSRHGVTLEATLNDSGFLSGEWFCKDFELGDAEKASASAVRHLVNIRESLRPGVLYGFGGEDGLLKELRLSASPRDE